jgi:hypothetical protein
MDLEKELFIWRERAQDLVLENSLLRMSIDIVRLELEEEKARHGA